MFGGGPKGGESKDSSSGCPVTGTNGCAYLNLDDVHDTNGISISYLRFCYADLAVTTPTNSAALDVWNCQFLQCHSALNSRVATGTSTNRMHNTLFSACSTVFAAQTNAAELDGEQVTADVWSFWSPEFPPGKVCLTNSIVLGEFGRGPVISNQNVVINPELLPFVQGDAGFYYLAPDSSCRCAGTENISAAMLQQLRQKTTCAPISLSGGLDLTNMDGDISLSFFWALGIDEMTLFPVAKRYAAGGPPDLGYYYDPLDYTVAAMFVTNKVTVLPGTAVGFRNDFLGGFFLQSGSSFVAQGTPTNPIVFADMDFVQEGPLWPGTVYQSYTPQDPAGYGPWFYPYGGIDFICLEPGTNGDSSAPSLDMRFCNVYSTADDFPVSGGDLAIEEGEGWELGYTIGYSYASSVNWTMQDCNLEGGNIILGPPSDFVDVDNLYPSGSVLWKNNLLASVGICLYLFLLH